MLHPTNSLTPAFFVALAGRWWQMGHKLMLQHTSFLATTHLRVMATIVLGNLLILGFVLHYRDARSCPGANSSIRCCRRQWQGSSIAACARCAALQRLLQAWQVLQPTWQHSCCEQHSQLHSFSTCGLEKADCP